MESTIASTEMVSDMKGKTPTRKLAAIMFTDIVGYTTLMSKDEQKALQLLQRNREVQKPLIREFNGEWLKEMGDGTLSSFHSAVDAVNCAIAIQKATRDDFDLNLRIGIHIGDVVFSKGDIFGDGVNVASRIEPLAEPGGICISGRVYDDIRNKPEINTIFLGKKTLKHVGRPIKVYAVTGGGISFPESKEIESEELELKREKKKVSDRKMLVVLPFENLGHSDDEYFADGITEEITARLSHIERLGVIARTSAIQHKNTDKTIRKIGEELGVEYILEGTVRWQRYTEGSSQVRITPQLIKVSDATHLWADVYKAEMADIFKIQSDIAETVAQALDIKLFELERKVLQSKLTNNLEAKLPVHLTEKPCHLISRILEFSRIADVLIGNWS